MDARTTLFVVGLGVAAVAILGGVYAMIRNEWVYRQQCRFGDAAAAAARAEIAAGHYATWRRHYEAIPDYDDMMAPLVDLGRDQVRHARGSPPPLPIPPC